MRSNFQNRFSPFLQKQTYELMVIRRRIFEMFDVEVYRDLQI